MIVILYFSLKSFPFSAKVLIVGPVVIYSGAKDKAAFLKEEYVIVIPDIVLVILTLIPLSTIGVVSSLSH
jgi:hypothetical protein